jgi:hypothetical protein
MTKSPRRTIPRASHTLRQQTHDLVTLGIIGRHRSGLTAAGRVALNELPAQETKRREGPPGLGKISTPHRLDRVIWWRLPAAPQERRIGPHLLLAPGSVRQGGVPALENLGNTPMPADRGDHRPEPVLTHAGEADDTVHHSSVARPRHSRKMFRRFSRAEAGGPPASRTAARDPAPSSRDNWACGRPYAAPSPPRCSGRGRAGPRIPPRPRHRRR